MLFLLLFKILRLTQKGEEFAAVAVGPLTRVECAIFASMKQSDVQTMISSMQHYNEKFQYALNMLNAAIPPKKRGLKITSLYEDFEEKYRNSTKDKSASKSKSRKK